MTKYTTLYRVVALLGTFIVWGSGCTDWLAMPSTDVAGGGDAYTPAPVRRVTLSESPASAHAQGPLIPSTPGLRVPEGYWTRLRLDDADLMLSHTWASLNRDGGMATLRLMGSGPVDADGRVSGPSLRAVLPLTLPADTEFDALVGVPLSPASLRDPVLAIRLKKNHAWYGETIRLTIDALTEHRIVGTLEGVARRGSKGRTKRSLRIGFVAIRAPGPAPAVSLKSAADAGSQTGSAP